MGCCCSREDETEAKPKSSLIPPPIPPMTSCLLPAFQENSYSMSHNSNSVNNADNQYEDGVSRASLIAHEMDKDMETYIESLNEIETKIETQMFKENANNIVYQESILFGRI